MINRRTESIIANFFTPKFELFARDPRSDHAQVAQLGAMLGDMTMDAAVIWDMWTDAAHRAKMKMPPSRRAEMQLPYGTWEQRFSGKFPSYLPQEEAVLKFLYINPLEELRHERGENAELIVTAGGAGGGKSTILNQWKDGAFLSDPDEGVLEHLGPYLFARTILKTQAGDGAPPDETPEQAFTRRNVWRMPPYDTFRWASNAINTNLTAAAVRKNLDVLFGWTGAGAFGLKMLKEGFKELYYDMHLVVVVTDEETALAREVTRARPATWDDFTGKRTGFIEMLPQVLAAVPYVQWVDNSGTVPVTARMTARQMSDSQIDDQAALNIVAAMQKDVDKFAYQPGAVPEKVSLLNAAMQQVCGILHVAQPKFPESLKNIFRPYESHP